MSGVPSIMLARVLRGRFVRGDRVGVDEWCEAILRDGGRAALDEVFVELSLLVEEERDAEAFQAASVRPN